MSTLSLPTLPIHAPLLALRLACAGAWRGARRGWLRAAALRRTAALHREGLRLLQSLDERALSDIGLSRCDLPWMAQRDAFAQLLEDTAVYNRAHGLSFPAAPRATRG